MGVGNFSIGWVFLWKSGLVIIILYRKVTLGSLFHRVNILYGIDMLRHSY